MLRKCPLAALVVAAELVLMIGTAAAFDDSKYPDWSAQWRRPSGVGTQWDQTKPAGLAQKAPLIPEYQARLEASIADQARGGQGGVHAGKAGADDDETHGSSPVV